MPTLLDQTLITETLTALPGWHGDATQIWRDVHLSPENDAELRRQVGVDSGASHHAVQTESIDGGTRYLLSTSESGGVTELDIALASHISDLVHRLSSTEPGIDAMRSDDPIVVFRAGEGAGGDELPLKDDLDLFGSSTASGGTPINIPGGTFAPQHQEPAP